MKILLSTTALVLTLAFSGMAYAHDESAEGKDDHMGSFMDEAVSKLPEKDAAQFRETMKQAHEKDKDSHKEMKKLHDDLKAILTADKFDKSAFLAKNKELEELHEKTSENMTEAFATAVSQLPQSERKTLADEMAEEHHHNHYEHHHHHDGADKSDKSDKSDEDKAATTTTTTTH